MAYTTIQGDTWDLISYKVYGNEMYADRLMAANTKILDIFVFSAGTSIEVPEVEADTYDDLPPWRSDNE